MDRSYIVGVSLNLTREVVLICKNLHDARNSIVKGSDVIGVPLNLAQEVVGYTRAAIKGRDVIAVPLNLSQQIEGRTLLGNHRAAEAVAPLLLNQTVKTRDVIAIALHLAEQVHGRTGFDHDSTAVTVAPLLLTKGINPLRISQNRRQFSNRTFAAAVNSFKVIICVSLVILNRRKAIVNLFEQDRNEIVKRPLAGSPRVIADRVASPGASYG